MIVQVGPGVVGKDASHWGQAADGSPILCFQTAAATVRVAFTPEEARDHGCAAIFLATQAFLTKQTAEAKLKPSSALCGPDGLPLTDGRH